MLEDCDDRIIELKQTEVELVVDLCLNFVVGLTNPGMMKVRGLINQTLVIVLIDCGVTHNFLSLKIVE